MEGGPPERIGKYGLSMAEIRQKGNLVLFSKKLARHFRAAFY